MSYRKAVDGKAAGLMVVLCVIWSLQQIVLKAAADDMAPVMQIAVRSGLAALLVGILLVRHSRGLLPAPTTGAWRPGLLAGFLFALEYLLVGEGLRFTSASHVVVFLYTAPAFAALGLHWKLPEERLQPLQWLGLGLAFFGIVLAFYDPAAATSGFSRSMLWGDFLSLLGGMAWAGTTIVIRCSKLAETPATYTVFYQLLGAFVLLLIAAAVLDQLSFTLTPIVLGSLFFQTLVVSFLSFLVWFWLLRHYLASRLGVLSFLTPVFGIIFGVVLLGETIELQFLLGSGLVLIGITLVSGYQWVEAHRKDKP